MAPTDPTDPTNPTDPTDPPESIIGDVPCPAIRTATSDKSLFPNKIAGILLDLTVAEARWRRATGEEP